MKNIFEILSVVTCCTLMAGAAVPEGIPPLASDDLSCDPFRPQLRYTQKRGWANDPNGLVFWKGEWHFFHQYNPFGVKWGNMHWNHAVSKDLVHWTELGLALKPDDLGTMFSGSAVTDVDNTAGFGAGAQVLIYTAAGKPFTQCLAYSQDGRIYTKYAGNPVLKNLSDGNRDPRVFWHAPTKAWVMALYGTENGHHVMWIFNSPNLKDWTKVSTYIGGDLKVKDRWLYECPGLEEIRIEGEEKTAWVVWGADDVYGVGDFDGKVFMPRAERLPGIARGKGPMSYYAAQTYADAPDGRTLWVAWYRLPYLDGSSYQHSFSLPQELTLRRTADGLRLVRRPARELKALRTGSALSCADYAASKVELAEVDVSAMCGDEARLAFNLAGVPFVYEAASQSLTVAGTTVPWKLVSGKLAFKIYLDRVGLEIFSDDGLQMAPIAAARPKPDAPRFESVEQKNVANFSLSAFPLKSIWANRAL